MTGQTPTGELPELVDKGILKQECVGRESHFIRMQLRPSSARMIRYDAISNGCRMIKELPEEVLT